MAQYHNSRNYRRDEQRNVNEVVFRDGTRRRCVRLSPIAQYSPLLPPVGVWAVSQSQCGWSSSQTS